MSAMEPSLARRRPVLLVAEDDEDILALLLFGLERAGYEVIVARNGEEALARFGERAPDLLLLDVTMPRLDGLEVTRRVRAAAGASRRTPIILLTAQAQRPEVARGLAAGADDYVPKPFSLRELRERIEAALAGEAPHAAAS